MNIGKLGNTDALTILREGTLGRLGCIASGWPYVVPVKIDNKVGVIGEVISAIILGGSDVGAIDIADATGAHAIRDITVDAASVERSQEIVDHVVELPGGEVVNVSDRTFLLRLGGKIKPRTRRR